jgi:hypothetical protein
MSPQIKAYCAIVRQLSAVHLAATKAPRDPDQNPAYLRLQELSDIALSIARFGTSAAKEEFYDLLTADAEVAGHAAAAILGHFQAPEEIRERALTLIVTDRQKHEFYG